MRNGLRVGAVIPALNEEKSIGKVLSAIPDWVDEVVVADNGSSDRTAGIAKEHGAHVVREPHRGYGAACLAGIAQLKDPDIVLFMDGDYSDYPQECTALIDPIAADKADVVIGSRVKGNREFRSLTPQARFGNWLACLLMRHLWKIHFTDLGPFRAISFDALRSLHMRDLDYGWTVEMQIKAAKIRLRVLEVPVSYRTRIGKSKVSGTMRGVIGAGTKILWTIFKAATGLMRELEGQLSAERIIVFTRYPQPGMVKTRLVPVLGDEGAAALHKSMTEHIINRVQDLEERRHVVVEVRYDGGTRIGIHRWLGPGIDYREQHGRDLGERMAVAFQEALDHGSERVLLIGSDCPGITCSLLEQALDALRHHDVVFGPACDGGYYLVGMTRFHPRLFSGLTWGTSDVLQRTLDIATTMNLSVSVLTMLRDVDRPEDIRVWHTAGATGNALQNEITPGNHHGDRLQDRDQRALHDEASSVAQSVPDSPDPGTGNGSDAQQRSDVTRLDSMHPRGATRYRRGSFGRISVIIPALNEAETLPAALASVGRSEDVETIVVDGGSVDETVAVAQSLGARTTHGPKGRGIQMNLGAAEANGDILLFLHADTRLPPYWADHVRRELAHPGVSAGAFRFRTDGHAWSFRIIEFLANFRATWFQMPYGDQALFVRANLFRQMGGFPDLPVMEDFEFVRRMRSRGRVSITHAHARTSSRRWKRSGILKTSVRNQVIIIGYVLGISPETLSRLRSPGEHRGS
jgi:uncharacterized protein